MGNVLKIILKFVYCNKNNMFIFYFLTNVSRMLINVYLSLFCKIGKNIWE